MPTLKEDQTKGVRNLSRLRPGLQHGSNFSQTSEDTRALHGTSNAQIATSSRNFQVISTFRIA